MKDFSEKTILITGVTSGLGKALAIGFSRLGSKLVLVARNQEKLDQLKGELENSDKHLYVVIDISSHSSICIGFEALKKENEHLDLLINNAGSWFPKITFEEMSDEQIIELAQTNTQGTMLVTKHALPLLSNSSNARIINVLSASARASNYHAVSTVAFAATKWAIAGFSETLNAELRKKKISVTNFFPGAFANESSLDTTDEELKEHFPDMMSLKELFETVCFIASRSYESSVRSLVLDNR